jgi:hypothetical protein
MKKILMALIGLSLFAATAEAPTIKMQIILWASCFTVLGISTLCLKYLEKKEE